MAECYALWNATKRERVSFTHVGASTARELAGQPAAAAIIAWYLLQNPRDAISVLEVGSVPDSLGLSYAQALELPDRTDHYVELLITAGILKEVGFSYRDKDEPDTVYVRDLKNVWVESDA